MIMILNNKIQKTHVLKYIVMSQDATRANKFVPCVRCKREKSSHVYF